MSRSKKASRCLSIFTLFSIGLAPFIVHSSSLATTRLSLDLSDTPKVVRGFARGSISLHNLVGDRDSQRNRCMGYGAATPDHILSLPQNVKQLKLQVTSDNHDTTLIIKGPNGQLRCVDDSPLGKDAGITLNNLKSGDYSLWVGTFDPKQKFPYSLSVE